MKAVFGVFISLVIALVLFSASAFALNPDDCAEWIGPEWNCLGRVEVSDMGTIMPDGSFNWDGPESAGITSWDPNMAQYHPFEQFVVGGGFFDIRRGKYGASHVLMHN